MEKGDYSQFKNLSIYDTNLIRKGSYTGMRFEKNGICTLSSLLIADDAKQIDFGPSTYSREYFWHQYFKGLIKLIRYKYLGEDLELERILANSYKLPVDWEKYYIYGKTATDEIMRDIDYDLRTIGFTSWEIRCLLKNRLYNEFAIESIIKRAPAVFHRGKLEAKDLEIDKAIYSTKRDLLINYISNLENNIPPINEEHDLESIRDLLNLEKSLMAELRVIDARRDEIIKILEGIKEKKQKTLGLSIK